MIALVAASAAALLLASPPAPSPEEIALQRDAVRAADLSHSPEVLRFREDLRARKAGAITQAGASPSTGMTVSDIGRVTVVRDATFESWENGNGIDDVFGGTEDSVTAFFEAHPDSDADFVMIIQDWINTAFPGAFYLALENDTTGIGYQHSDPAHVFDLDPTTPIEGFLWLNGYEFLVSPFFSDGRILWGQEFGHRWGAFVNVDTGGGLDDTILGRQSAHWSWYLDSDWSWMEGNDWTDNLDGTWTTNTSSYDPLAPRFSPLDLYLMGLVGTADVPSFTQLIPAEPNLHDPGTTPDAWPTGAGATTIAATPRVLTIQDVIAAEGPRVPSFQTSEKDFDVAVVFALRRDDRITPARLAQMEALLDSFDQQWTDDTLGLSTVTFGVAGTKNAPPVLAAIDGPATVKAGTRARFDAGAATDPEGQALTFFWRWDAEDSDALFEEGDAEQGHTFGGEGVRVIEVSVRDANGAETIVPLQIEITPGDGASGCGCTLSGGGRSPSLAGILASSLGALAFVAWRRRYRASGARLQSQTSGCRYSLRLTGSCSS